jgi:hypothetical protein
MATQIAVYTPKKSGGCGYIILKKNKNWHCKYSFHGPITQDMVHYVNRRLKSLNLKLTNRASHMQFKMSNEESVNARMSTAGHFTSSLNTVADLFHAEDILVVILESMEDLGYHLQFHYLDKKMDHKFTLSTKLNIRNSKNRWHVLMHKIMKVLRCLP